MNCDSAKRGEGEARHGDSNKDFQQADVYHKMIVEIEDKVAVEKEREADFHDKGWGAKTFPAQHDNKEPRQRQPL